MVKNRPLDREQLKVQRSLFAEAFALIEKGIADHVFPGASVAVTQGDALLAHEGFGKFTYTSDSPPVDASTMFDIASVSKVLATTAMAMLLCQRGLVALDSEIDGVLPEASGLITSEPRGTFRMLLEHSSGLPAHEKFYLSARNRDELLRAVFSCKPAHAPGTHTEYSDIGFILLGIALERIAGEAIDSFCRREIFGPLGMLATTYNPPKALRSSIPPTVEDRVFRNCVVQGEVNDENAWVMGGVAGHAGVFSTAEDVTRFARSILRAGSLFDASTVQLFTKRAGSPAGTSRALGWDTPSAPSQSGKYLSPQSYGHLGYTGTSLWIDPERDLTITLLTNRTWPDATNQAIRQVRPAFHDAVVRAIERKA